MKKSIYVQIAEGLRSDQDQDYMASVLDDSDDSVAVEDDCYSQPFIMADELIMKSFGLHVVKQENGAIVVLSETDIDENAGIPEVRESNSKSCNLSSI